MIVTKQESLYDWVKTPFKCPECKSSIEVLVDDWDRHGAPLVLECECVTERGADKPTHQYGTEWDRLEKNILEWAKITLKVINGIVIRKT